MEDKEYSVSPSFRPEFPVFFDPTQEISVDPTQERRKTRPYIEPIQRKRNGFLPFLSSFFRRRPPQEVVIERRTSEGIPKGRKSYIEPNRAIKNANIVSHKMQGREVSHRPVHAANLNPSETASSALLEGDEESNQTTETDRFKMSDQPIELNYAPSGHDIDDVLYSEDDEVEQVLFRCTSIFDSNPYRRGNIHATGWSWDSYLIKECETDDDDDHTVAYTIEDSEEVPDYSTWLWTELLAETKLAAQALGFDQAMWDANLKPFLLKGGWDALTTHQKLACIELGYFQDKWKGHLKLDTRKRTLGNFSWKEMPPHVLKAAKVLGYSQDAWTGKKNLDVHRISWHELSENECRAAMLLYGFEQNQWGKNRVAAFHSMNPRYGDYRWGDLPSEALKAAITLGYTPEMWEDGIDPQVFGQEWESLTDEQRSAAFLLHGFDKKKWDNQSHIHEQNEDVINCDQSRTGVNYIDMYAWKSLPREKKLAAEILGYTEKSWNLGGRVSSMDRKWEDLTIDQEVACEELHIDQQKWEEMRQKHKAEVELQEKDGTKPWGCWRVLKENIYVLGLALPATFANIEKPLFDGLVSWTILTGMGPSRYLAWTMANLLVGFCDNYTSGIIEAGDILITGANDKNNHFLAALYLQLTQVQYVALAIPLYGLLIILAGLFISALGFGDEIAELVKEYIPLAALSHVLYQGLTEGLRRLMWSDGLGSTVVVVDYSVHFLYWVSISVLTYGFESLSMYALGMTELFVAVASIVAFVLQTKGWFKKYDEGIFGYWALRNKHLKQGVLDMAGPLNRGNFVSRGTMQALVVFAATMGPAETISWTIMQVFVSIFESLSRGITNAAEVRVSRNLAKSRPHVAKAVVLKSIIYAILVSLGGSAAFYLAREPIVYLYATNALLFQVMDYHLFPLACVVVVSRAISIHCHGLLSVQGREVTGNRIAFWASVAVVLPMATGLVFIGGYGQASMMMACAFGNSIAAFVFLLTVLSTNWSKASRRLLLKVYAPRAKSLPLESEVLAKTNECTSEPEGRTEI